MPYWPVIPLIGVVAWRWSAFRWRDTASWTVPIGVAMWLSDQLAPVGIGLAIDLALYGLVLAMIFVEPLAKRWLAVVAPGHYTTLPGPDLKFSRKLGDLEDEYWAALRRIQRDGDESRFSRSIVSIKDKTEALVPPDEEWGHIKELWRHFLGWYEQTGTTSYVTEEEFDELNRRGEEYSAAFLALRDRRSYRLGARSSRESRP